MNEQKKSMSLFEKALSMALLIAVVWAGVSIGDGIHDARYDYVAQCPDSSVKSADSSGIFKIIVECY